MIDIQAMVDAGDAYEVAEAFGIETAKIGPRYAIRCPSHERILGRPDNHIQQCVLSKHGYYCYSCHESGNFVKMVAEYMKMPYSTTEDKQAAAAIVAEKCYPEYLDSMEEKLPTVILPYSKQDLMTLGLLPRATVKAAMGTARESGYGLEPDIRQHLEDVDAGRAYACPVFIRYKTFSYSLEDLYKENPEGFEQMVQDRAAYWQETCQNAIDSGAINSEPIKYRNQLYRGALRILNAADRVSRKPRQEAGIPDMPTQKATKVERYDLSNIYL